MVFLDWEFIALCRRHRLRRSRCGGAKMFPRAICFSLRTSNGRERSSFPQKCARRFGFGCRDVDLIDREKYWNPRSMNFQRATTLPATATALGKILFSLFSVRVSLSLVDLSVRPSRGTTVTAVGAAEQVQKLLAEKGGSIGNDAFCPVMNYEERTTSISRDAAFSGRLAAQWQQQRQWQQRLTE